MTKNPSHKFFIHLGISLVLLSLSAQSAFAQYPNPLKGASTIPEFLAMVLDGLWLLLTPLIVIFIIYAGFLFVTAQGEEGKIQKARHAIMWALVGTGVIFGADIMAKILRDTVSQLNQ